MDQFENEQVLENRLRLAEVKKETASPFAFLDELASAQPTPGGGSAAAFTAAEAAALVAMVARLTIGKKKYADVEGEMIRLVEESESLRSALTAAILKDAAAFDQLMAAYRLPKETDDQVKKRDEAVRDATFLAAEVPLETVRAALAVIELALVAVRSGNINAITDAGSAAALALAAISRGGANVRINLQSFPEEEQTLAMLADLEKVESQSQSLAAEVKMEIKERAGIALM
jgi:formiminotetrahydrofolate cyclodeaminase